MTSQAFVLLIYVTCASEADLHKFIELWKPLAEHVAKNEPETLAYELSISDKEANRLLVYERYAIHCTSFIFACNPEL